MSTHNVTSIGVQLAARVENLAGAATNVRDQLLNMAVEAEVMERATATQQMANEVLGRAFEGGYRALVPNSPEFRQQVGQLFEQVYGRFFGMKLPKGVESALGVLIGDNEQKGVLQAILAQAFTMAKINEGRDGEAATDVETLESQLEGLKGEKRSLDEAFENVRSILDDYRSNPNEQADEELQGDFLQLAIAVQSLFAMALSGEFTAKIDGVEAKDYLENLMENFATVFSLNAADSDKELKEAFGNLAKSLEKLLKVREKKVGNEASNVLSDMKTNWNKLKNSSKTGGLVAKVFGPNLIQAMIGNTELLRDVFSLPGALNEVTSREDVVRITREAEELKAAAKEFGLAEVEESIGTVLTLARHSHSSNTPLVQAWAAVKGNPAVDGFIERLHRIEGLKAWAASGENTNDFLQAIFSAKNDFPNEIRKDLEELRVELRARDEIQEILSDSQLTHVLKVRKILLILRSPYVADVNTNIQKHSINVDNLANAVMDDVKGFLDDFKVPDLSDEGDGGPSWAELKGKPTKAEIARVKDFCGRGQEALKQALGELPIDTEYLLDFRFQTLSDGGVNPRWSDIKDALATLKERIEAHVSNISNKINTAEEGIEKARAAADVGRMFDGKNAEGFLTELFEKAGMPISVAGGDVSILGQPVDNLADRRRVADLASKMARLKDEIATVNVGEIVGLESAVRSDLLRDVKGSGEEALNLNEADSISTAIDRLEAIKNSLLSPNSDALKGDDYNKASADYKANVRDVHDRLSLLRGQLATVKALYAKLGPVIDVLEERTGLGIRVADNDNHGVGRLMSHYRKMQTFNDSFTFEEATRLKDMAYFLVNQCKILNENFTFETRGKIEGYLEKLESLGGHGNGMHARLREAMLSSANPEMSAKDLRLEAERMAELDRRVAEADGGSILELRPRALDVMANEKFKAWFTTAKFGDKNLMDAIGSPEIFRRENGLKNLASGKRLPYSAWGSILEALLKCGEGNLAQVGWIEEALVKRVLSEEVVKKANLSEVVADRKARKFVQNLVKEAKDEGSVERFFNRYREVTDGVANKSQEALRLKYQLLNMKAAKGEIGRGQFMVERGALISQGLEGVESGWFSAFASYQGARMKYKAADKLKAAAWTGTKTLLGEGLRLSARVTGQVAGGALNFAAMKAFGRRPLNTHTLRNLTRGRVARLMSRHEKSRAWADKHSALDARFAGVEARIAALEAEATTSIGDIATNVPNHEADLAAYFNNQTEAFAA